MRLSGTKANSTNQYRGLGEQLYDLGGARPTLDLNFANNESLVDSVTGKNLVTHTRASSATYVDGDGNIQTAVTNYFEDSEGFNASSSFGKGAFKGTVTDNAATAPDESTTATLLVEDTQSGGRYITNNHNFVANTTYTVSCWAKQYSNTGTQDRYFGFVFPSGAFSVNQVVAFNLTGDGSFVVNNGTGTASIEAYPDGWYRCSLTATATVTANKGVQFRLTNNPNNGAPGYTGDGVSGIYIWGAQLEESSTVGEYVKTTGTINSAPRFDHDPTTGESLGLLVEESRTNLADYSEELSGYSKNDVTTPLDSSVVNPTGSTGSYKILADSGLSAPQGIRINKNATSANNIVVSAFVKKSTYRYVYIGFGGISNSFTALFDIEPGLTSNRLLGQGGIGTHTNIDAGYQNFSNDWIRIWAVGTTSGTAGITLGMSPDSTTFSISNWTAAGTEEIYAWGLQYEDNVSFPTSYIPTSGSTVTRATDVASISGNDFGTFNLLQYSEEFNDVAWSSQNASVISNATTAPNGAVTADKIVASGGNGEHNAFQSFAVVSGQTYTFSCYLKAAERTIYSLSFRVASLWPDSSNQIIDFDLVDGTTSISLGTPTSTIVYAGNGWYRCSITSTAIASGTGQVRVQSVFDADGEGVLVWGAQLEESSTVTPYVKSDVTFTSRASTATYHDYNGVIQTAAVDEARNVAFLPDGNGNFVSAGELLLEDAGTNILLRSEEFTNSSWTKSNTTAVVNAATAPDGTTTAEKIVETTATSEHNVRQDTTSQSAGTYTFSIFAKAGERSFLQFVATGALGGYRANFDLSNGTLGSVDSQLTASIVSVGNGWYRCIVTATTTFAYTLRAQWNIVTSSTAVRVQSYAGDTSSGLYLWGAQLEESSYPTSYIPTSGATATRAADVSSSSSNTFGNSFYDQTKGTVFSDTFSPTDSISGLFTNDYTIHDGTGNEVIRVTSSAGYGAAGHNVTISDNGTTQFTNSIGAKGIFNKIAIGYKLNDTAASANSSTPSTDTSCTIPLVTKLSLGGSHASSNTKLTQLKRLTYWPTRLSNDTLQTITK